MKHYSRWRRHGDPSVSLPTNREKAIRKEVVSASAAHRRVSKVRGRAAEHECLAGGHPAQDWAYDHTDPSELQSDRGPYSLDIHCYVPLCRPHHRVFDGVTNG